MARSAERFVDALTEEQVADLTRAWKEDASHRVRCRAHAVLISNQGVSVAELCVVFDAADSTIRDWLDRWKRAGLDGLEDEDRSGRPPELDDDEQELAVELLEKYPRQPARVLEEIQAQTGKSISRRTLRRIAKAAGLVWKRMRRIVKPAADDDEADEARKQDKIQAKADIETLQFLNAKDCIDLYFFDEAGFSMTPAVPYGWQEVGETIGIPASKGPAVQALGFMAPDCQLAPYCVEGTVDSQIVIRVFDDFAEHIERPTVVVLDNAPVHTSRAFKSRIPEWAAQGLELYFLPGYSPELNLIERLWKAIKYRWLDLDAYTSLERMKQRLNEVLCRIGDSLKLDFET